MDVVVVDFLFADSAGGKLTTVSFACFKAWRKFAGGFGLFTLAASNHTSNVSSTKKAPTNRGWVQTLNVTLGVDLQRKYRTLTL